MASGYVDAGDRWYYILHPRPAYVIVARGPQGKVNFMAASWVMPLSEEPPRIVAAFDKEAYTTELALASGAFTVNVLPIEERDFIYTAGTTSGREVDKTALLGARFEDTSVGAPRLAQPRPLGYIAARIHQALEDAAEDVYLVIADVVEAKADPELFNPRYGWELKKTRIAMHAAGRAFTANSGLYVARRLLQGGRG